METPAEDVVIKSSNSDDANEELQQNHQHYHRQHQQQYQQQPAAQEEGRAEEDEDDAQPARLLPLSPQEQLEAMARRREAAVCFRNQVEECRLALRYSVIGWTGTLDPETIPAALQRAPSIRELNEEMDDLERRLAPFLPAENNHHSNNSNSQTPDNTGSSQQGLGPESLAAVGRVREQLLAIRPGTKSTRHIKPVLEGVRGAAREAGILPPRDNMGWVWSLAFDDWFVWRGREGVFVSSRGARTDFVAA